MYQNTYMIDRLSRQKEEIENLIKNYQNLAQQTPVNNYINTNPTQTTNENLVEWRILNENEEVDNLYVQNKTLFISDNLMVLKGVDGSLQKWEVKKVYPVDKKDEKISELQEEVRKLKEMISNEYEQPVSTTKECEQPNADDDVNVEPKPKTNGKSISRKE